MKTFLSIAFILFSISIVGQTRLKYNGNYKIGVENGYAKYEYYENEEFERIYDGDFEYKDDRCIMKGKYIEGKKTGKWSSTFKGYQVKVKISGEYFEGQPIGNWTHQYNVTEKISGNYYNLSHTETIKIKNNRFVDSIVIGKDALTERFTIPLNDDGLIDGIIIIRENINKNYENYETKLLFSNGILIKSVTKHSQTGAVLEKFDISEVAYKYLENPTAFKTLYSVDTCYMISNNNTYEYLSNYNVKYSRDFFTQFYPKGLKTFSNSYVLNPHCNYGYKKVLEKLEECYGYFIGYSNYHTSYYSGYSELFRKGVNIQVMHPILGFYKQERDEKQYLYTF